MWSPTNSTVATAMLGTGAAVCGGAGLPLIACIACALLTRVQLFAPLGLPAAMIGFYAQFRA